MTVAGGRPPLESLWFWDIKPRRADPAEKTNTENPISITRTLGVDVLTPEMSPYLAVGSHDEFPQH